ncbi:MAG: HAD family hydrolase [Campylobacterota bacterium]|nr:HAD family hydrolase [Campylobacterota bacterium]
MTILFDLDGTLIDSTEAILESFHNSFKVHRHTAPSDEKITALIGHPLDVMYRELGVNENQVWNFVATYKEHYRIISKEKTLMLKNAVEAVELASAHARVGIVTTKTGKYSRVLLEHFGIMHHFEVLVGREDVQNPKPHAEPIEKAVAFFTCNKETCWMIGDTRLDLESAQNAKINAVGVLSGYDNAQQLLKYCDIIKKDALEAVQFIIKQ